MWVIEMLHIEVRKKIVEARKNGLTIEEICKAYHIGKTAVFKLLKQERETGDITPKTHLRGRKPVLGAAAILKLKELIDAQPDITLAEIKVKMELSISLVAIHNTIHKKLGYQYKKRQYTPASVNAQM